MDGEETSFTERWLKGDHLASRGWCWQPLGPSRDAHLLPPHHGAHPPYGSPPTMLTMVQHSIAASPSSLGLVVFLGGLGQE